MLWRRKLLASPTHPQREKHKELLVSCGLDDLMPGQHEVESHVQASLFSTASGSTWIQADKTLHGFSSHTTVSVTRCDFCQALPLMMALRVFPRRENTIVDSERQYWLLQGEYSLLCRGQKTGKVVAGKSASGLDGLPLYTLTLIRTGNGEFRRGCCGPC